MKRIAVCLSHYSLANSPSIVNLLTFLAGQHNVDLFLEAVAHTEVPEFKSLHFLKTFNLDRRLSYQGVTAAWRTRTTRYDCHVAFDPHGFALCRRLFPGAQPFYYSLELYLRDDHFGLDYPEWLQVRERSEIHEVCGLIIQSAEKEALFRRDYGLSKDVPALILPVTYLGSSNQEKTNYLREAFPIPGHHRIAIHLGSISELFSCIELAKCFGRLQDWSLVFHGYPKPDYLLWLRQMIKDGAISNVHVHDRQFASLNEVDKLVRSADLGIAWYEDISAGFRTAGMSSGKIPCYLKFGLPVVAKKYPSTSLALEKQQCGMCVDTIDEIPAALSIIEMEYGRFSVAACGEYDRRYRFENYADEISAFLGIKQGNRKKK